MQKRRLDSLQNAQGLVEFALVLPILLLVILGIFAFGHLFFVYSSTVSASREAARFGAAVGVTAGGVPRFRDCDAIRAVAVQRGLFAGVRNDASVVNIQYDQGPGTTPGGACPVGGTGPEVALGDRIIVTVTIQYQSIVPLVNLPSFPLSAVTRRTIIRDLQVGVADTAEPVCPLTTIVLSVDAEPSRVGQPVTVSALVEADDGTIPENEASIVIMDSAGHTCTLDAPGGSCNPLDWVYWDVGEYTITAQYAGDICYEPSIAIPLLHQVIKSDTITTITSDNPDYSTVDQPILVFVNVAAAAPGARNSWAGETVSITDGVSSCMATLNGAGNGNCSIVMTRVGMAEITATYGGDDRYNPSFDTEPHLVYAPTPTFVPTPTFQITPTNTPKPDWCPVLSSGVVFTTGDNVFHFNMRNPHTQATNVTSVSVTWPDGSPIARLSDVRFDVTNARLERACTHNNGPECLWYSNQGVAPPSQTLGEGMQGWTTRGLAAGQTKQIRLVFSHDLQNGPFRVLINFSNGCSLDVEAIRLVTN